MNSSERLLNKLSFFNSYTDLKHKFKHYLSMSKLLLVHDSYTRMGTCDVLLCCHDVDRGETLHGRAYSKLIDSLAEYLAERGWICAQFAFPYSVLIGDKAWGNPTSANRRLWFGANLLRLHHLGAKLGIRFSEKTVEFLECYQRRFYDELFDRTQCRCVITIGAPPAMCSIARKRELPVIELLHGIGYKPIPWNWDKEEAEFLPTGILSLDDISTKTFAELSDKGVTVRQIPHPWFRRFMEITLRDQLPEEWKQIPQWLPTNRRIIMVSLSWGYDNDHGQLAGILANGLMHEDLVRAIELTQDSVFWLLRLHPVQLRLERYNHHRVFLEELTSQTRNCEWHQASTLPLPLLLSQCHGHITMSSMTTYEAAFLAVPSLLLCPTLRSGAMKASMFGDLRLSGYAELGEFDAQKIKVWAESSNRCITPFQASPKHDLDSAVEWMLGSVSKHDLEDNRALQQV